MKPSLIALMLWVGWFSCGMAQAAEADTIATKEKSDPTPLLAPAPAEDLEDIQGLWTRTERTGLFGRQRVTKEVKGDSETVTYYGAADEVTNAHTARIELRRAGPIKVFLFHEHTFTAGPNEGEKQEGTGAYVYKVVGDTFIEVWGVLGEGDSTVEVLRWTRGR